MYIQYSRINQSTHSSAVSLPMTFHNNITNMYITKQTTKNSGIDLVTIEL